MVAYVAGHSNNMLNDIRLDFDLHWGLSNDMLAKDPLNRKLKSFGRYIPYRIYLVPTGELLCERVFDIQDWYYVREIHHLHLAHGQWSISVHEPTGYLDLKVKNFKLNTVQQPGDSTVFTL